MASRPSKRDSGERLILRTTTAMHTLLALGLLLQGPLGPAAQAVKDAAPTPAQLNSAVQQPIEDIGLIRKTAPPVVLSAAGAPYDTAWAQDCDHIAVEILALDGELGPDVDIPQRTSQTHGLVADVIKGALSLPYDGVVRRLSGAERRDQAYRRAVLAAEARRGFLKGRASLMKCAIPPAPAGPVPAADPAAAATSSAKPATGSN